MAMPLASCTLTPTCAALQVVGMPMGGAATPGGTAGMATGLTRQAWETDRAYAARAKFASGLLQPGNTTLGGAADPNTPEGMRLAALTMVWQNTHELGCVYPSQVAAQVGVKAQEASGMAVEGERRAQQAGVP
jgi:hypothetical protein